MPRPAVPSPSPAPLPSASPTSAAPPQLDLPRLLAFLGLAVGATALLSLPFALDLLPEAALGPAVPLAQLSPLLAALLVRRRDRPWRRALALTVPSRSVLAITALAAVAAFTMVPLARVLIGIGAGAPPIAAPAPLASLLMAVPAVLVMQGLFAIGEEAGWRGWLHDQLAPFGFWRLSLLIGALWALWHAPIVLALGMTPRESVTYLGTIVAVAPLLAALREISGTAWAAVIGHALFSSVRVAIEQNVLGPVGTGTAWLLDAGSWVLWLAAAWMVLRVGGSLAPQGETPVGGADGRAVPAASRGRTASAVPGV